MDLRNVNRPTCAASVKARPGRGRATSPSRPGPGAREAEIPASALAVEAGGRRRGEFFALEERIMYQFIFLIVFVLNVPSKVIFTNFETKLCPIHWVLTFSVLKRGIIVFHSLQTPFASSTFFLGPL